VVFTRNEPGSSRLFSVCAYKSSPSPDPSGANRGGQVGPTACFRAVVWKLNLRRGLHHSPAATHRRLRYSGKLALGGGSAELLVTLAERRPIDPAGAEVAPSTARESLAAGRE